jgi:hypothetical protein
MGDTMKKMNFRTLAMVILAAVFITGFASGAFIYATGKEVSTSTWMEMVSHTEYRYGEQGQIISRLVNFVGNPVSVDNCTASIWYPNKTVYVSNQLMADSSVSGDHYINFTTPSGPEGVYEYQSTCYYAVGPSTLNQSVTNSFHLSSAFNSVLGNLSALSTQVASVNASLASDIADLSTQLNANTSQILAAIDSLNVSVNFTPVLNAIADLNNTVLSEFSVVVTNQQEMNTTLNSIDTTVTSMSAVLDNVNTTVTNTYTYVTGSLTTKVDSILTDLGVINATVNRIETVAGSINSTVTTILENQENEVRMDVFSG